MKVMSNTARAMRIRAKDARSWISFLRSTQIESVLPRRPTRTVTGVTKTSITSLKVRSTDILLADDGQWRFRLPFGSAGSKQSALMSSYFELFFPFFDFGSTARYCSTYEYRRSVGLSLPIIMQVSHGKICSPSPAFVSRRVRLFPSRPRSRQVRLNGKVIDELLLALVATLRYVRYW